MRSVLFWSSIALTTLGTGVAITAVQTSEIGRFFQGMVLLMAAGVLAILFLGTGRRGDAKRFKAALAEPPPTERSFL